MKIHKSLLTGLLLVASAYSWRAMAQATAPDNWFNLDNEQNKVMGVSSERAYKELLAGKKPKKTIIVAVIDSGVEPDHSDLKGVMWVNSKEVAGNGVDDDKNGYVDDVYGWNFIGGAKGNVKEDSYEITRVYTALKNKEKRSKAEEAQFKEVKSAFEAKLNEATSVLGSIREIKKYIQLAKKAAGKDVIEAADLDKLADNGDEGVAKKALKSMLDKGATIAELEKELTTYEPHYENQVKYAFNPTFDSRTVIGDDPRNVKERFYGNNDVEGPDAGHGTHVAGIIAADRTNDIGMKGVADNVKIMSVRAVPDGDERDKDVANAIRYAVDNGAQVINMSFGKGFSPDKKVVDAAVKYAEKKGVLLVHAAGNSSLNIDEENNFPTRSYKKYNSSKQAKNWLEVGALSWAGDEQAPAPFSNYGKKNVDLFAPGVDIYSTIPNNGYEPNSGTSMAAPVVSGVAALVWSYYPELTMAQLRDVLVQSVVPINTAVNTPGSEIKVNFQDLSRTGGVVNAYRALQLADKIVNKK